MDCCIVIPLCPKHYHYARRFVERVDEIVDVYFIFSNEHDASLFPTKHSIIMPHAFPTTSIVTEKKFHALRHLQHSHYDYFIVCDAEIDLVPENFTKQNILEKIENIFRHKRLYGGIENNPFMRGVSVSSAACFSEQDKTILRTLTEGFRYYLWWSDLPVYRRADLCHFFSVLQTTSWNQFDHYIYAYYLLLYHDFQIVDATKLVGHASSLENYCHNSDHNLSVLQEQHYGFSWANACFYNKKKEFLKRQGTFLIFHLDRGTPTADPTPPPPPLHSKTPTPRLKMKPQQAQRRGLVVLLQRKMAHASRFV